VCRVAHFAFGTYCAEMASPTERFYITDTDLSARFPLYTRANVGEVFPDPVTPLSATTMLWFAELGWRDGWERLGGFEQDEFPPDQFSQLGVLGGYCYLNASLIRIFGERAPGLSWQDMDAQFFGTQPGVPPYAAQPGDDRPDLTEKIGGTFMWALGQHSLDALTDLTRHREESQALRAARPDFTAMTHEDLWAYFQGLLPKHRELFCQHIFTTYMATVPVSIISAVATAVGRPDLILPIIAGIGEVDSAAPSHAMWAMSRMPADSAEFTAAFEKFLYEFGSRGPNEWEARSPTWETRPGLALSAIDRMRGAADAQDPSLMNAARAAEREEAAATLIAMVEGDPGTHLQLAAAIAASKAWIPGRERSKTNNIRHLHEVRMTLREIGTRLVGAGAFDEIEDFGFVTAEEIPTVISDPKSLTTVIRERRAAYNKLGDMIPAFIFDGNSDPRSWERKDESNVDVLAVGDVLVGMPGCTGIVEGIARVILDSNDPSELEPGDILVAPITDPSWTPLFVPAGGVVVDVGAPLSHAIIVSRELGIPCVISATDATRRIPNGARIRVDGNTGMVTILSV
jgi:rifampicin phosphotransferase